ncbi:MAG: NAD(P)/FAD-dependent oxidoreductase [Candidatus Lokiarchaeota archaeon]|nr:NAD(P)/FAD-dependent oxidoreductase [Candidatus Lokiarchaeota archaeon]
MKEYDVLIVGGGPAGAIIGKYCADKGLKTIIFERGEKPGEKTVSGCGLSPKLWKDFKFMNEMFDDLPYRLADMATIHIVDKDNKERSKLSFSASEFAPYPEAQKFLTINIARGVFDPWLMKYATNEGAELKTKTTIIDMKVDKEKKECELISRKGEKFKGKIILAADGAMSTIARKTGLKKKWNGNECCWMINYDFAAPKEKIDLVAGGNALHYYYSASFPTGYIFYTLEGFHLGLGSFFNHVVNESWKPKLLLNKLYDVQDIKKQVILTGGKLREYQAHLLPMIDQPSKTFTDHVLLLGDAAGFLCPFEAEGVYYAMLSGEIATKTVEDAITNEDFSDSFLSSYETNWKNSIIGEEFLLGPSFSSIVRGLFFNPSAANDLILAINDIFYNFTNVAETHYKNLKNLEDNLSKHAPLAQKLYSEYLDSFIAEVNKDNKSTLPINQIIQALFASLSKKKKQEKN